MDIGTDIKVITKQIVINEHTSSKLLPITADEKIIDEIQSKLDKAEANEKELNRLREFKKSFDEYELSKKRGFIAYENWQDCEKELSTCKVECGTWKMFYDDLAKDVNELISLVVGDYDMSEVEEDMAILDGNDLRIAELIVKLSKVGKEK